MIVCDTDVIGRDIILMQCDMISARIQVLVHPSLNPKAHWEFDGEIVIL